MTANPAFAEAIARAEAECQYARETIVTSLTGKPDVDSANARWWLERRRRADYGPELNLRAIPTEQLRELLPADTQPTALPSARDLTPDEEDAIDSVFRDRE